MIVNTIINFELLYFFLGYPLAVKLGTITKEGKADIYSYEEGDMVIDPYLAQHLIHFGVNISNLEKVLACIMPLKILFCINYYELNVLNFKRISLPFIYRLFFFFLKWASVYCSAP